ncbi:hypothetical protein BC830DRAFT_1154127 [Chytriomyces sp. MP71]|nr:hypothetical protein BC830DRAFT_1154127 [Chytriomyces sp. MP71]
MHSDASTEAPPSSPLRFGPTSAHAARQQDSAVPHAAAAALKRYAARPRLTHQSTAAPTVSTVSTATTAPTAPTTSNLHNTLADAVRALVAQNPVSHVTAVAHNSHCDAHLSQCVSIEEMHSVFHSLLDNATRAQTDAIARLKREADTCLLQSTKCILTDMRHSLDRELDLIKHQQRTLHADFKALIETAHALFSAPAPVSMQSIPVPAPTLPVDAFPPSPLTIPNSNGLTEEKASSIFQRVYEPSLPAGDAYSPFLPPPPPPPPADACDIIEIKDSEDEDGMMMRMFDTSLSQQQVSLNPATLGIQPAAVQTATIQLPAIPKKRVATTPRALVGRQVRGMQSSPAVGIKRRRVVSNIPETPKGAIKRESEGEIDARALSMAKMLEERTAAIARIGSGGGGGGGGLRGGSGRKRVSRRYK